MVAVLVGDKDAVAVTGGKAQRLSAAEVVRTPLPISTMRYRCPQRTTLLLPEEPEYNEMNSAMKNL